MTIGTVKFFNQSKGYGFIMPDDGTKDVFVHVTALKDAGIMELNEGQKVSFEVQPGRDGKSAAQNLQLVD
ncbi:MAG: cold-shock protein [Alphaproteobacteria bacterium]|nr:MAG: cold-shock protein [Alphaproteobacteria bacterium]